jgi:Nitrate reductase gamma subunit
VSYNAGYTNVHELIPWRTLIGRQQFYQDHPWMIAFGEGFSSYRPPVDLKTTAGIHGVKPNGHPEILLNFITPHQKWGIHSTCSDNLLMLTLNRGFGHTVGLLTPHWLYESFITPGQKQLFAVVSGGAAGLVCSVGLSLLLHRRMFDPRIRLTSHRTDLAILVILWVQLALGLATLPYSLQRICPRTVRPRRSGRAAAPGAQPLRPARGGGAGPPAGHRPAV